MDLVKWRRRSTAQRELEIRKHLARDVKERKLTGKRKREHLGQIKTGRNMEREHTTKDKEALDIALDHLKEHSDYYIRLKRMEAQARRAEMKRKRKKEKGKKGKK